MDAKQQLEVLRGKLADIDKGILALFAERMNASVEIADIKAKANLSITDETQEARVIERAAGFAGEGLKAESAALVRSLISLSKLKQRQTLAARSDLLIAPSVPVLKETLTVACQGARGAWGEQAAAEMYPEADRKFYDYFEDVFAAVKNGEADFGVLPIENSQTGAIGEVYDLLRMNGCSIAGQVWIPIRQCLLGVRGAALSDIREVFSHSQGLTQCRRFLKNKNWDLSALRNTAVAAQTVMEKGEKRYAAIGSRWAAEIYGLDVIAPDIMDDAGNQTRFITIASQPVYDETCDITSVTFSTEHISGALCSVLHTFMAAGVNLSRIESRPVSADRYRFFADLQANVLNESVRFALEQASAQCRYFEVLGCYRSTPGSVS